MRYKSIIAIALLMVATMASAQSCSAQRLARKVLPGKTLTQAPLRDDLASAPISVFNADGEGGFVVVGGDGPSARVIGYSHSGTFNPDRMPHALHNYLAKISKNSNPSRKSSISKASEEPGTIIVDALCKTEWDQDVPFNQLCPKFGNQLPPCGCVATAMAQIMKYWEWPASGRGNVMYNVSGYGVISRDFSQSHYNWSIMKNKGGLIRDAAAREAMALICYDAGVSVKMGYALGGSGAHDEDARTALPRYFKYRASTMDLRRRECYEDLEAWMFVLRGELDARRPVLFCGQDSNGGGGHAFIVDGYDSNDFVHVNWGWGGMCNGFYDINTLAPDDTNYSFSDSQSMMLGIQPDPTEQDNKTRQYRVYMQEPPTCKGVQDLGKPIIITYNGIYNIGFTNRTYTVGVGLFDAEGNLLKEISVESSQCENSYTQQFKSYYGFGVFKIAAQVDTDTHDGKYAIRAIFQEKGFDDWMLPDMVGGDRLNWIPVVVKDGKVYVNAADGPEAPSAIETIEADASPARVEYYDLQGRRVLAPSANSLVIKKTHHKNGRVTTTKEVYK